MNARTDTMASGDDVEPLWSVELTDADHDRIRELAGRGLTEDEAERIVRFARTPREERVPEMLHIKSKPTGNTDGSVDGAICGQIRAGMRQARRPSEVIDAFPTLHPSTIYQHTEGRCPCDTDVPPTTSPRIQPDECGNMRRFFRSGMSKKEIMAEFYRSANAVNKHLSGECECSTGEPPIEDESGGEV